MRKDKVVLRIVIVLVSFLFFFALAEEFGWASEPSIFIDSVSGAPTPNASGSPEAMSPVTASNTCHTNGVASTTIEWPSHGITLPAGNSCSGTDNCALLFLGTASGRQFSEIISIPNGNQVVVEDTFNIAAASAVNCAVGGRLTSIEAQLALDMKGDHGAVNHGTAAGGWQIFLVNAGANYTHTATIDLTNAGFGAGLYGVKSSGVRPTIDCNFQPGICINMGGNDLVSVEVRNTNVTKTGTVGLDFSNAAGNTIRDSIIGGSAASTAFEIGIDWDNNIRILAQNAIRNNTTGIELTGINDETYFILSNVFRANDTAINATVGSQQPSLLIFANIFWENSTAAIVYDRPNGSQRDYWAILYNTFHDNGVGLDMGIQESLLNLLFAANLLTQNTTGVSYTGATMDIERESALVDFNCYGTGSEANGTNISGFILGPNVLNLDPEYANSATGDFTPTNSSPTFVTWPPGLNGVTPRNYPGTTTPSQPVCGAIQPAGGVGGFSDIGI